MIEQYEIDELDYTDSNNFTGLDDFTDMRDIKQLYQYKGKFHCDRLWDSKSHYHIAVGGRNDGKTTNLVIAALNLYLQTGRCTVYLRQMDVDIKGANGASICNSLGAFTYNSKKRPINLIAMMSKGYFNEIVLKRRGFYLAKRNEDGSKEVMEQPFILLLAVSQMVHFKSTSLPNLGLIVFDEFINASAQYLPDECFIFFNMVSTLVRDKDDVKIFMLANSTTWNNPYFKAFGLTRKVRDLKMGDLAIYKYKRPDATANDIEMSIAVEYCTKAGNGSSPSDVYFLVDDERMKMITNGTFAIPEYPKCPIEFKQKHVKVTYWLYTDNQLIRARLMRVGTDLFVFVEPTRQEAFDSFYNKRDVVFSLEYTSDRNHFISPLGNYGDIRVQYLRQAIQANRVFFANNEVGEDFTYYVTMSSQVSVLKVGN